MAPGYLHASDRSTVLKGGSDIPADRYVLPSFVLPFSGLQWVGDTTFISVTSRQSVDSVSDTFQTHGCGDIGP